MVIENEDKVSRRGYLCPQDSRGGGGITPNNPPFYASEYIPPPSVISETMHSIVGFEKTTYMYKHITIKTKLLLFKF